MKSLIAAASVACLVLASVPSPRVRTDLAAFEAGWKQTDALLSKEKWKEARAHVAALLAAHEGARYVIDRRADVEDVLRQCALGIACPRKTPKEALLGTVVSYDRKSGSIEAVYKRAKGGAKSKAGADFPGGDFEGGGTTADWRPPFVGPYAIELRGSALGQVSPRVRVAIAGNERYEVEFNGGDMSTIEHFRGDEEPRVVAECTDLINVARPYTLKVRVSASTIEAFFGSNRMLSASKESHLFGRFGFQNLANLEEIRIEGKVDAAWVESRIDELTAACRDEFLETYDVKLDFPQWLR